jgi:micrococcal nuclease
MQIKKYIFISSILINLLFITLVFTSNNKEIDTQNLNDEQKQAIEVNQSPNPNDVAGVSQEKFLVKKVIDGDTITLDNGKVVRYIGIDTPELSPEKECFSREATEKNRELVEGKMVSLEKDVSETDRYGRLLRYVYSGQVFINDYLVREGYAKVSTYPPDVKYQQGFIQAEKQAREEKKGLWGDVCIQETQVGSSDITCKYSCDTPDRDCADFFTQKEAQEFFDCCGFTAENDPMKLDNARVDDGIPCEFLP